MKKSLLVLAGIVVTMGLALSGCSKDEPSPVTPTPTTIFLMESQDTLVQGGMLESIIEAKAKLKSLSSSDKEVRFRFSQEAAGFGHIVNFCFGDYCYSTTGLNPEELDAFTFAANSETEIKLQVLPNRKPGTSTVRFVLYDVANPTDTIVYRATVTAQ